MRWFAGQRLWLAAYWRVVASSFRTVPLYRERWALSGRTDPVVVPGRTGVHGGAIPAEEALRRLADLVPLAGGDQHVDPMRGLGPVLASSHPLPAGALVAVLAPAGPRPPSDLPARVRGCVVDLDLLASQQAFPAIIELSNTLRRAGKVLATGEDKALAQLHAALPDELAARLDIVPMRELDGLDTGPGGLLHDPALGFLGALRHCGRWHLDWPRVYARPTSGGLAFTLLRQRSPRMVDILLAGGVAGAVAPCPRHGTPVVVGRA
jgi:hypothetical protein